MRREEFKRYFLRGLAQGAGLFAALAGGTILAVTVGGTIHTFSTGEIVSAAKINENFASLRSAIEGLPDCSEHTAIVYQASQSVATGTGFQLSFGQEEYDPLDMHTAAQPGRITIDQAGRYLISAYTDFSPNGTGVRYIQIAKNGAGITGQLSNGAVFTNPNMVETSAIAVLAAGDYVSAFVAQDSGTSLNALNSRLAVSRLCGN